MGKNTIYLFIYASGGTKIVYTYTNTDKSYIRIKSKDKTIKSYIDYIVESQNDLQIQFLTIFFGT